MNGLVISAQSAGSRTAQQAAGTYYRVITYSPDIVRDERINVGIFAFDEQRVLVRITTDWDRIKAFARRDDFDPQFVRYVARSIAAWTPQQAKDRVSHYMSCTAFTEPRASITSVYALADRIADRMLGDGLWEAVEPAS